MKMNHLRNAKRAFSEKIEKLEKEKAELFFELEEQRLQTSTIDAQLKEKTNEIMKLTKKYRRIKRRASKQFEKRQSHMKIVRPNTRNNTSGDEVLSRDEDEDQPISGDSTNETPLGDPDHVKDPGNGLGGDYAIPKESEPNPIRGGDEPQSPPDDLKRTETKERKRGGWLRGFSR